MKNENFIIRNTDDFKATQESKQKRLPVRLILDNLRSAFNVGSIFRTADCVGLEKVYLCGITAHPPNQKVNKTALGTVDFIAWEHAEDTLGLIRLLKKQGVQVIGVETTSASIPFQEFEYPFPVCFVLGNEALGIPREILEMCDHLVEIPVRGFKNSLNVAVAAGIILYECERQWIRNKGICQ